MGVSLLLDMAVLKSIAGRIRDTGLQRLTALGVADQTVKAAGTSILFPALLRCRQILSVNVQFLCQLVQTRLLLCQLRCTGERAVQSFLAGGQFGLQLGDPLLVVTNTFGNRLVSNVVEPKHCAYLAFRSGYLELGRTG